jgi:sugar phosphate isomerase/epimerase
MNHISRRTVLKNGCMTAASMAFASAVPRPLMARSLASDPGIQLYTVGKELMEDMAGTLAKLASIGYRSVENLGTAGKSAIDFRKGLDDAGLRCTSSHIFLAPGQTAQQFFQDARTLGSEYVVSNFIYDPSVQLKNSGATAINMDTIGAYASSMTQDDYKKLAADLNKLASLAKSLGLKFAYHNHNVEFRKLSGGTTPYDILMAEMDPALVKIELDCGWATLAGHPPLSLFKKYPGRFRMLHIKDFVATGHPVVELSQTSTVEWAELGKGHIDYRVILAAAPAAGVEHIFVEQEPPYVKYTALDAAQVDYKYLQAIK